MWAIAYAGLAPGAGLPIWLVVGAIALPPVMAGFLVTRRMGGVAPALKLGLLFTGIARALSTIPIDERSEIVWGSPHYLSPEQARGRSVDKRTDIFSFGCVLYEMLTSRPPFPGETVTDALASTLKTEPGWSNLPADIPPTIQLLLRRCLAKDPDARFQNAQSLQQTLADCELTRGWSQDDAKQWWQQIKRVPAPASGRIALA